MPPGICRCGEPKLPGRGKRYCASCLELAQWKAQKKRNRRKGRKPCQLCGRPKGPGPGRRFCEACLAARKRKPACVMCGDPPRYPRARLCEACYEISQDRKRWRSRKYNRRRRAENLERTRTEYRESRLRRYADPTKREHDLEQRRLTYRLKAQAAGRTMRQTTRVVAEREASLPGRPLAAKIDEIADNETRANLNPFAVDGNGTPNGYLEVICERAGVAPRAVIRWRIGESAVTASVADQVLTRLGLFWWDVWTEETVRLPLFVVHVYARQWKTVRKKRKKYRVRRQSVFYGDRGPDLAELQRVQSLMSGEVKVA